MNTFRCLLFVLAASACCQELFGDNKPAVKESAVLEAREKLQNKRMANFKENLRLCTVNPTAKEIKDLRAILYGIEETENEIVSEIYRPNGRESGLSVPSTVVASQLKVTKSVNMVRGLLDEAKNSAIKGQSRNCKIRLSEVAYEIAATSEAIAELRKNCVRKTKLTDQKNKENKSDGKKDEGEKIKAKKT